MNRNTPWLAWLLGTLVVGLFGAMLYTQLEPKQVTIDVPGSAEARRNPLLAAQRMLQRMGQKVAATPGSERLRKLPADGDLILLYHNRTPLNPTQRKALLAWVERGGHLVMDVAQFYDERTRSARSPLLDQLQVGVTHSDSPGDAEVQVKFEGEAKTVAVRADRHYRLVDRGKRDLSGVGDDLGYVLLQIERGDGLVTLINDLAFIANDRIGEAEHAYFLYDLINGDRKVWLLYDPYTPSLADLAWKHLRALLFSLLALVALWIWYGNRRLGPVQPSPLRGQRDLIEHLDAQGGFDWRHGLAGERFRASQQAVMRQWTLRYPRLTRMDQPARAEWIAEHLGRDVDEIRQALFEDFVDQPDFIRRTRLLQALWQHR